MDSCFYIPLECLYFLIISSYYGNSIYPCFGNYVLEIVWIFASREIFKKFIIFECWFFPYFSRTMRIHFSHVLGTLWISASRKICKKPWLWNIFFLILFSYYRNSLSPCFGDNATDVETIPIVFSLKHYVKLFTKLSYFVSDSLSAFQIPLSQKYGNIYSTEK